jgi:hypothetical protein
METKRLKLPAGIQTFEKLRKENCVYVDKTKYLVDLIDNGSVYFLARPRRFGKSLTISTLDALFSGKKELFKGLKAAEEFLNRPDFKPSPVIRLDMSDITTGQGIDILELSLKQLTIEIADLFEVEVPQQLPSGDILRNLIAKTAKKYNQKVVILIDEYDKPYTDFMNDSKMAEKVRTLLRDYYSRLKANDEYIRFILITGISKFTRMGVFSTLNNLTDISMMPEYAGICGYTEKEIKDYFPDYLDETAKYMQITVDELMLQIRNYYNGFSFDRNVQESIYNPYSTLCFFKEKHFSNFWFDSGTPKFIADYMKNKKLTVEQFRNLQVSDDFARNPGNVDTTLPEGFLFQSGYLTLRPGITNAFSLDYPNTEVLNSMSNLLTQNIFAENINNIQTNLLSALMYGDVKELITVFNILLASIPFDDFANAAKQSIKTNRYEFSTQEWLYRSNIFSFLRGCGITVFAEMHTNKGRPDIVIFHKGKTWVIEIKVAYKAQKPDEKAKEALQQIVKMNYAEPFPDAICVGLAIDDEKRLITDHEIIIKT